MDGAAKILNVLLSRASRLFRDFIIDQTNVFKSARKRDLKPFANFVKIAVVLFTRAEELQFRADKRFKEMGKEAPAEAANEMLECGPPKGVGKVYQSYGVDDAYNRTGADGRHLLRGLQLILAGATLLDPYNRASSLSYNTCNSGYAVGFGGTSLSLSHEARWSATPFPYGSYGTQIPTSPYGSFPKDVQQAGVYPHLL